MFDFNLKKYNLNKMEKFKIKINDIKFNKGKHSKKNTIYKAWTKIGSMAGPTFSESGNKNTLVLQNPKKINGTE